MCVCVSVYVRLCVCHLSAYGARQAAPGAVWCGVWVSVCVCVGVGVGVGVGVWVCSSVCEFVFFCGCFFFGFVRACACLE